MIVAVTQRVIVDNLTGDRKDALDQNWISFLRTIGLLPLILPNEINTAFDLIAHHNPSGLLLTGGNNLHEYAGNAPERDTVETRLLQWAIENQHPALGICRGMQMIQHHFGIKLHKVANHICQQQKIIFNGQGMLVNSYHNYGATQTTEELDILAIANDDVIKAIQHKKHAIYGIMWHPERIIPFRQWDKDFFKKIFVEHNTHA